MSGAPGARAPGERRERGDRQQPVDGEQPARLVDGAVAHHTEQPLGDQHAPLPGVAQRPDERFAFTVSQFARAAEHPHRAGAVALVFDPGDLARGLPEVDRPCAVAPKNVLLAEDAVAVRRLEFEHVVRCRLEHAEAHHVAAVDPGGEQRRRERCACRGDPHTARARCPHGAQQRRERAVHAVTAGRDPGRRHLERRERQQGRLGQYACCEHTAPAQPGARRVASVAAARRVDRAGEQREGDRREGRGGVVVVHRRGEETPHRHVRQ